MWLHTGCTDTRKRVCTESWLWEKNPLPHRGIEPASAVWRSDVLTNWATSPPCREDWKRIAAESSVIFPRRSNRTRDWTELNLTELTTDTETKNGEGGGEVQLLPLTTGVWHISSQTWISVINGSCLQFCCFRWQSRADLLVTSPHLDCLGDVARAWLWHLVW